uniref:Uncharacterized protein n=1 Tax=Romanomermis culicivorax TaxID=13658 RepID=A0A915IHH5_ROMCU
MEASQSFIEYYVFGYFIGDIALFSQYKVYMVIGSGNGELGTTGRSKGMNQPKESTKTLEKNVDLLIKVLKSAQDREKETKDKPIVVKQVVATEEKCPEIAFVGNAQNGSTKKYNQMKARPQNQLQKAVEEQRSDGNGEEMQPGPSTRDVKQTNEEQAKESFLAILSKEWL